MFVLCQDGVKSALHIVACMAGQRKSHRERLAELLEFATEHFLNDAELAQQHAQNLLIEGLYSEQYWVSLAHVSSL